MADLVVNHTFLLSMSKLTHHDQLDSLAAVRLPYDDLFDWQESKL
jgi:hypothetical protein